VIDDFIGEIARRGRTLETRRKYRIILNYLYDAVPGPLDRQVPLDARHEYLDAQDVLSVP
jgi:hypothetical protein